MLTRPTFVVAVLLCWLVFVLVAGLDGMWMSPIASPNDTGAFGNEAEKLVDEYAPLNIALVLIERGKVIREVYSKDIDRIDQDTVFQTASMSKWITATAVMKLVGEGKLNLDAPIKQYLTRWNLPGSSFDHTEVTIRRLLSHTSGLTDGLGFGDYLPDEIIPSLEEQLTQPRASAGRAARIEIGIEPGSEFRYSGGGYLILQLIVEEVTGASFENYISQSLLEPLGMSRSGYEFIGELENHAGSYDRNGVPAELYRYGSNAATGFVSSASDLVRFSRMHLNEAPALAQMRAPHGSAYGLDIWGLGTILYAPTTSGDFVFGHDGANDPAINTAVRINPETRDAIIVLVTGHPALATQIGSAWVFWQTGTPDALDTDSVFRSMIAPAVLGTAGYLLLVLLALLLSRRR